ncbi:MAG: chemotaxis protein CheW [Bacteriovorax sp.]|jgi:purine-binding chemotaxis protein CheW
MSDEQKNGLSINPPQAKISRSSDKERRVRKEDPPEGIERRKSDADRRTENNEEFVSFQVAGQLLGISVLKVQEVLPPQPLTHVPLAVKSVAGLLNLRGQIVTVVDLRERLELPVREEKDQFINIIVRSEGELFSLLVDSVGDVISVARNMFAAPPSTLDACWRQCCEGVYQLNKGLLVIVDVPALLDINDEKNN